MARRGLPAPIYVCLIGCPCLPSSGLTESSLLAQPQSYVLFWVPEVGLGWAELGRKEEEAIQPVFSGSSQTTQS